MCELNLDRSLAGHFATLADPRCPIKRHHDLIDMIVIAIAAVICGADAVKGSAVKGSDPFN
jgi:hypothetical protein